MNKIFRYALILLFPAGAAAQDCKLHKDTDPYTKEIKLTTGYLNVSGATLSIEANKLEIDFQLTSSKGDKCFDGSTQATLFFADSKLKYTLRNGGTMNCDGYFHFVMRNSSSVTPSFLQKITKQKVASIIIKGRDGKDILITLSPEQQEQFFNLATCIAEEAKTLVKVP